MRGFKSGMGWDTGRSEENEPINGEWQSTEHKR